jgi:phosphoglycerate dehydrogenase-like enzyme
MSLVPANSITIYLSANVDDARLQELVQIAPECTLRRFASQEEMERDIAGAEIVAGPLSREAFLRATKLRWLHSWLAGPNTQLFDELVDSAVAFTCSKGNGAIPLAEHAMMLMLMLQRDAVRWIDEQRAHIWGRRPHEELLGKTIAILGTGYSGADLALKAKAFHMRVTGMRRSGAPAPNFDRMYKREELHDFLAEADFVVVTAPRTPETLGMLGAAEFAVMKPTAYYICFSRGGIADDAALLDAIVTGKIAGAGLDAHDQEPLPPDSPFWDAPNTIVTPHNGATAPGTHRRGLEMLIENLRRYRTGEEMLNVVEKQAGY